MSIFTLLDKYRPVEHTDRAIASESSLRLEFSHVNRLLRISGR
jgi:hypothetical protein